MPADRAGVRKFLDPSDRRNALERLAHWPVLADQPTGRASDIAVLIKVPIRDWLMAGEQFCWDRLALLNQLAVTQIPEHLRNPS